MLLLLFARRREVMLAQHRFKELIPQLKQLVRFPFSQQEELAPEKAFVK
jgi:hypothetical protein